LGLAQCASEAPPATVTEKPAPTDRRLSLPENLSERETESFPAFITSLKEAGFIPTREAGGKYRLEFQTRGTPEQPPAAQPTVAPADPVAGGLKKISFAGTGGSVRCTLTLRQGARVVAAGEGIFEGGGNGLTPERALQTATDRCIANFLARLAVVNEMGVQRS
jgi:hypothetical protein